MARISAAIRSMLTTVTCGAMASSAWRVALSSVKSERGRKPHGAQQPQLVFGESGLRVTDRPQNAPGQVVLPADIVDDGVLQRVEEHAVDR